MTGRGRGEKRYGRIPKMRCPVAQKWPSAAVRTQCVVGREVALEAVTNPGSARVKRIPPSSRGDTPVSIAELAPSRAGKCAVQALGPKDRPMIGTYAENVPTGL